MPTQVCLLSGHPLLQLKFSAGIVQTAPTTSHVDAMPVNSTHVNNMNVMGVARRPVSNTFC